MLHVEIMVNGAKFDFYNESRNTRNGFAYDSKVYVNGLYCGKATCYILIEHGKNTDTNLL